MHRGYLPIWRKFFDEHPFWKQKRRFSKAEAWIDLLRMAHFGDEPREQIIYGRVFTINYGEIVTTARYCAMRWRWPKTTGQRFFNLLKNMQQIGLKTDQGLTRIIILNYSQYDIRRATERATRGPLAGHWRATGGPNIKTNNNNKNEKNINKKGFVLKKYPYPQWLNLDLWRSFCEMRKTIKKPITTDLTITRLLNALKKLMDQGHDQTEIIQLAIDNCWSSFWPPRKPSDESKYV